MKSFSEFSSNRFLKLKFKKSIFFFSGLFFPFLMQGSGIKLDHFVPFWIFLLHLDLSLC